MANAVKKLKPGMAVVYRLTAYSMVRTGELLGRNASKDGWLIRDDGDRKIYELRDGVARIRVPDEPRQLDAYRRHTRVVGACAGRMGVLPNACMDRDEEMDDLEEEVEESRMFGNGRTGSLFIDRHDEEVEVEEKATSKPDAAGMGEHAAKAIEERLAK